MFHLEHKTKKTMPPKSEARIFNINDFIGWNDRGELIFIDCPLPRWYFWGLSDKQKFIQHIFDGLPVSPIHIILETDIPNRKIKRHILDGNKKLEAIIAYCNNEFSVNGKTFEKLDEEEKNCLLNTNLFVAFILVTRENYSKADFLKTF